MKVQMEDKISMPDSVKAGADKGRATQSHAAGKMSSGKKAAIHAQANRVIGHTFHSIKESK